MKKAKQAAVASALGLAVLATPLTLPSLGDDTGSAQAAEVGGEVTVDPVAIGQAIDDAKNQLITEVDSSRERWKKHSLNRVSNIM